MRVCTCRGSCKGPDGLGEGYVCAMSDEYKRYLDINEWRKGVALVYSAIGEPNPPGLCCAALAEKVLAIRAENEQLQEELKAANTLLGDAAFYIRRMARIIEGYNHPSRIHARAIEWLRMKWHPRNQYTRWDREGRDVTNLPGLWSEEDVEVSSTNFPHPTITAGQHTNGPATIWLKRCVDGAEWVCTGLRQMHKVRDAWVLANEYGSKLEWEPKAQVEDITK